MEVSDADREALIEFCDELNLLQTKYSDHRQPKLLGHCTTVAETVGGLAEGLGGPRRRRGDQPHLR
jgi:phytoene/squalene synthetase